MRTNLPDASTKRARNVEVTPHQRRCNVMTDATLYKRQYVRWVLSLSSYKVNKEKFLVMCAS